MPTLPSTTADAPAPKTVRRDDRAEDTVDHDDEVYEEAAAHILKPMKRRTDVSPASFAAARRSVSKP